jgi:hypothetical protein
MGKTNSLQEEVIKELTEHSLAAPFVFAPDNEKYQDREPADLVWACNKCVILMYMTEKKVYPDKTKRDRIRKEAIDHNLGQAKKWLKKWKGGQDLLGANGYHTFCIKYDPACHVIVLSIIQCGDPVALLHDDEAKKLGLACCATLPQSAILGLATVGGTSLDLLALIDEIRKFSKGAAVPEETVSAIIASYARAWWDHFTPGELWPNYQVNKLFHEASYAILSARRKKVEGPGQATPNWIGMADLTDVFNDIFLGEFFYVTKLVAIALQTAEKHSPDLELMFGEARMNIYDFGICVGSDMSNESQAIVSKSWEQQTRAGTMRYGPIIIIDIGSRTLSILLDKRSGISQTELFLGKWTGR